MRYLYSEVLEFWFSDAVRPYWFRSTPELDRQIRKRFEPLWRDAANGGLQEWRETREGALALVIVLDQFPLNMFRGEAASFSTEAMAREVADEAIRRGWDRQMDAPARAFLYLPFMHSESLHDHDRSVELYREAGLTDSLYWAEHHREIVRRFGRFPHRNEALGRESTPDEVRWLESEEGFGG